MAAFGSLHATLGGNQNLEIDSGTQNRKWHITCVYVRKKICCCRFWLQSMFFFAWSCCIFLGYSNHYLSSLCFCFKADVLKFRRFPLALLVLRGGRGWVAAGRLLWPCQHQGLRQQLGQRQRVGAGKSKVPPTVSFFAKCSCKCRQ